MPASMRGEVVYLYAFDVADEIETPAIAAILGQPVAPLEIRTGSGYPQDVPLYRPLAATLPDLPSLRAEHPLRAAVHVFELGVINVLLRLDFEAATLGELHAYHNYGLASGESMNQVAQRICRTVCDDLRPHLGRGSGPTEPEAYTVFCITRLPGEQDAETWFARERPEVAGLLTETLPARLSESQIAETLRIARSYAKTDLAIIDWDASLVIDAEGYVEDVLYVLELANLQLEEFRVFDRRLDRYLERAYKDLERRHIPIFGGQARMLHSLRQLRMDVARLTEEVTHISKFQGDWHLARVYLGARERFYLDQWRQSVERRLSQLDHLYSVLHGETNEQRMLVLEAAIVVLFVIDLLAILFIKS